MVLKLEEKKAIVSELATIAASSVSMAVADYRGLNVAEMTVLRGRARAAGIYMKVVRNTLARKALENTEFSCSQKVLEGSVLLVFAKDEPGSVARLLSDFIKEHEKLVVCGLTLGGTLLAGDKLEQVAKLPSKDQAIAGFMLVIKAPITQLVRTMAESYAKLVRTLAAVRDQKGS